MTLTVLKWKRWKGANKGLVNDHQESHIHRDLDGRGTDSTVPELVDSWLELDVMVEVEHHMKDSWKEMGVVELHMKDTQKAARVVGEDGRDVGIPCNSSKVLVKARLR